jgi:hypothetical protein
MQGDTSPFKTRTGKIRIRISPKKRTKPSSSPLSSPVDLSLSPDFDSDLSLSLTDLFLPYLDMSSSSSVTTSDTHLPKIPFPQNESDFPLWSAQIKSVLTSMGLGDCIISARPATPAPFTDQAPTYSSSSNMSATELLAAKQSYLLDLQMHQAAVTAHNASLTEVKRWDRAFSFILSNLGRTQLILVRTVTAGDAKGLWDKLNDTYGAVRNVNTLSSLYTSLSSIYKPDSISMKDYIGQVQSLYIDLEAQGETISSARKKQFILDGLSRSHYYKNVASTLSLTDTAHTIALDDLIAALISEEKKRHSFSLAKTNSKALFSNQNQHNHQHKHKNNRQQHTHTHSPPSLTSPSPAHSSSSSSSSSQQKKKKPCYTCKSTEHNSSTCPSNPDRECTCGSCGLKGHQTKNCRVRNPRSHHPRQSTSSTSYQNSSSPSPASSSSSSSSSSNHSGFTYFSFDKALSHSAPIPDHSFIVDSGATRHFCCNKSIMHDLYSESGFVSGAQNLSCNYELVGKIKFIIDTHTITLNDVAYVPSFNVNLISVPRLTSKGAKVDFLSDKGILTLSPYTTLQLSFPRIGDLYVLIPSSIISPCVQPQSSSSYTVIDNVSSSSISSSSTDSPVSLSSTDSSPSTSITSLLQRFTDLHYLYGHISYTKLYKILSSGAINDSPFSSSELVTLQSHLSSLAKQECIGCLKGKMHREAITGTIDHQTKSIMDLWVVDDIGPFSFSSINDELYVLQIMDVHSHFPWSFMTKTKGEQTDIIISLIKQCQTITGLPLKRLHGDKAKQWAESSRLLSFLSENGTQLSFSHQYTPKHNALIERLHRSTLEGARAIMFHSHCYPAFYSYAILFMTFVLSRSLSPSSSTHTPLELFTKSKPSFSRMHTFGCDVHFFIHDAHRNKLEPKSQEGIFLGYVSYNPRYHLIYDLNSNRIIESMHTTFFDNKFVHMRRLCNSLSIAEDFDYGKIIAESDYLPSLTPAQIEEIFPSSSPSSSLSSSPLPSLSTPTSSLSGDSDYEDENEFSHPSSSSSSSSSTTSSSSTRPRRITSRPFHYDPSAYFTSYCFFSSNEPTSYQQAISSPESKQWLSAIKDELDMITSKKVISFVPRSPSFNIIPSRWVFKIKRDVNGNVLKYKARLVAKGYAQLYGFDYTDTFAPTLHTQSLRLLFILSLTSPNHLIDQLDVKSAFLNAPLNEDVYMEIPDGMTGPPGHCVKLLRALYGIKQAPNAWNTDIDSTLRSFNFSSCEKEPCLYFLVVTHTHRILIGLFVDDLVVVYHKSITNQWLTIKHKLLNKYSTSDLGRAQHVLGMRVIQHSSSLSLDQHTYINDKLKQFNMQECKHSSTPSSLESLTHIHDQPSLDNATQYRQIVGSLMYASIITRPDITYSTNILTRFMQQPQSHHLTAAKRVFRYLSSTSNLGLLYSLSPHKPNDIVIVGWCDADWGGNKIDRKSTSGNCIFINNNLVSWQTKKQHTVALSSAEAELISLIEVVKDILFFRNLLTQLNYNIIYPINIYCDNQSAIKIAEHEVTRERTKHIDIKYHFLQQYITNKIISLTWVESKNQLADIFTKSLPSELFSSHRSKLISPISFPHSSAE